MKDGCWPNIWSSGGRPSFGDLFDEFEGDGYNPIVGGGLPGRVVAGATRRLLGAPARASSRVLVPTRPSADGFDGRIELRPAADAVPEQRWHVPMSDGFRP